MYSRREDFVIKYQESIIYLSTSFAFLSVFILGAGRYRTILLFAFFYILKTLFSVYKKDIKILYYLFLPALLVLFYSDVITGQIYPIFPHLHFLITILIVVIVEMLFRIFSSKILQSASNNMLFKICPKCMYNNKILVIKCAYCSYSKELGINDVRTDMRSEISKSEKIISEIEKYKKSGLLKNPSRKIITILNLDPDDFILINCRIFPFNTFFKNDIQDLMSNLVMTAKKIYFIDYSFFAKGWRTKEFLSYDEIIEVSVAMKREFASKEPVLFIKAKNNYEIHFRKLFPYRKKIHAIVECIKKRNPKVNFSIDFLL